MGCLPHDADPSRRLVSQVMNSNPLRDLPKLSRIVIHRTRSLFDVASLLGLHAGALPKRALARTAPITRWNE